MQDDEALDRATGRMQRLMWQKPLEADGDEVINEPICAYQFDKEGRLILITKHGNVYIDIRRDDVNVFTLRGERKDFLVLPPK
jgi:hypothetical protein